jgi:hypothetical protein
MNGAQRRHNPNRPTKKTGRFQSGQPVKTTNSQLLV